MKASYQNESELSDRSQIHLLFGIIPSEDVLCKNRKNEILVALDGFSVWPFDHWALNQFIPRILDDKPFFSFQNIIHAEFKIRERIEKWKICLPRKKKGQKICFNCHHL